MFPFPLVMNCLAIYVPVPLVMNCLAIYVPVPLVMNCLAIYVPVSVGDELSVLQSNCYSLCCASICRAVKDLFGYYIADSITQHLKALLISC